MRESAGEDLDNLGNWWTRYQEGSDKQRKDMVDNLGSVQVKQQQHTPAIQ